MKYITKNDMMLLKLFLIKSFRLFFIVTTFLGGVSVLKGQPYRYKDFKAEIGEKIDQFKKKYTDDGSQTLEEMRQLIQRKNLKGWGKHRKIEEARRDYDELDEAYNEYLTLKLSQIKDSLNIDLILIDSILIAYDALLDSLNASRNELDSLEKDLQFHVGFFTKERLPSKEGSNVVGLNTYFRSTKLTDWMKKVVKYHKDYRNKSIEQIAEMTNQLRDINDAFFEYNENMGNKHVKKNEELRSRALLIEERCASLRLKYI